MKKHTARAATAALSCGLRDPSYEIGKCIILHALENPSFYHLQKASERCVYYIYIPDTRVCAVQERQGKAHEYSADKLSARGCHVTYTLVDHKWVCFADCCRASRIERGNLLNGPRGSVEYASSSYIYLGLREHRYAGIYEAFIICTGSADNASV